MCHVDGPNKIAILYVSDNSISRLLECRALCILGSASCAFYLLEYPCHEYLVRFLPHPHGRLLVLPIALSASILVWRFVAEPSRRFITRFRRRDNEPVVPPPLEVAKA
jgi:peptidoglycan/LPS O-acetylase OafA/YrhL